MTVHWPESTIIKRPVKRGKRSQAAKRATPERAIQVAIVKALHKHAKNCVWYAVPNGGHRHIYTAQKLKAEGAPRHARPLFRAAGRSRGVPRIKG